METKATLSEILKNKPETQDELKSCCANLYESEAVKFFLGESYHPGGMDLTRKLAKRLNLKAGDKVLDIASGLGTTSVMLAGEFKVNITGLDFSKKNCALAVEQSRKKGIDKLTTFVFGDAEKLPFNNKEFDVVISECAFCTFPNKQIAANEMYRVLKNDGRLGINDVILNEKIPEKWQNHISHILCLADAKSFEGYSSYLLKAGFEDINYFNEDEVFIKLAEEIRAKLLLAQIAIGLGKIKIPNFDMKKGKKYIKEGLDFIKEKKAGYGMIITRK